MHQLQVGEDFQVAASASCDEGIGEHPMRQHSKLRAHCGSRNGDASVRVLRLRAQLAPSLFEDFPFIACEALAKRKMPDLNARTTAAAMKIIAGTARQMGVDVEA